MVEYSLGYIGAISGRVTKGKITQYVKQGDFNSAIKEFDALDPTNVKNINTPYGQGKPELCPIGEQQP